MSIIAQAPVQFAVTTQATGTAAQQVQVSAAGVTAGLTAGNFTLGIPAEFPTGYVPITIKARGYFSRGTSSTVAIGLLWGKTQATATAAMYTAVASASLTGANPPLVANTFPWAVDQKIYLDAASQTASAVGPGSGVSDGLGTGGMWIGAANVALVAGIPPTQLTAVSYNATNQPAPGNGLNQVVSTVNNAIYIGIQFTNGTSEVVATTPQFVITSFYAVAD